MSANNSWWLDRFLDADVRSEWAKTKFAINGWIAATDLRTLVAVRGFDQSVKAIDPKNANLVAGMIADPPEWKTVKRSDLAAFCGDVPTQTTKLCDKCNGTGEIAHVCGCDLCDADSEDCPECGGDKVVEKIEERDGMIDGERFDLIRLARLLSNSPPSEALRVFIKGKCKPCLFECDEWRAVVAPKSKTGKEDMFPCFDCDEHKA